jgi:hypothetical protein
MYIPRYFTIEEMIPPEMGAVIQSRGAKWGWATLFDERLLRTMDHLRSQFGPMNANTWKDGGDCQYRGFRPPNCGVGAELSQHRFGRAVDLMPLQETAAEVRRVIFNNPASPRYQHIGALETDIHWLHIDVRGRLNGRILAFKP